MELRQVLLILILLPPTFVIAQNRLPPTFEITNDTANYSELGTKYWQILEDPSGKLTIDEVSKGSANDKFHIDSSQTKGIDNSQHIYWFRTRLRNKMGKEANLIFYNEPYSERYDFYTLRSGDEWIHQVNGVFIPYSKRDG